MLDAEEDQLRHKVKVDHFVKSIIRDLENLFADIYIESVSNSHSMSS